MWRGILSRHPRRAAALLQHSLGQLPSASCAATSAHAHLSSSCHPAPSSGSGGGSSSMRGRRGLTCSATAQAQAQEDVPEPQARKRPRCSPLHFNVEQFSIDVVPTEDERKQKHQVRRLGPPPSWPPGRAPCRGRRLHRLPAPLLEQHAVAGLLTAGGARSAAGRWWPATGRHAAPAPRSGGPRASRRHLRPGCPAAHRHPPPPLRRPGHRHRARLREEGVPGARAARGGGALRLLCQQPVHLELGSGPGGNWSHGAGQVGRVAGAGVQGVQGVQGGLARGAAAAGVWAEP
jgi:hypothetical protein